MKNIDQDHLWIIAIYKEETLQKTKDRLQIILELVENDLDIRYLVQDAIQILAEMTEEEFQALDLPVFPDEEES